MAGTRTLRMFSGRGVQVDDDRLKKVWEVQAWAFNQLKVEFHLTREGQCCLSKHKPRR